MISKQMAINLNSSDDNPSVILDIIPDSTTTEYEKLYNIDDQGIQGAIIPSANFEPIMWVIKYESLGIGLAHVAHNSVQRMIHLATPEQTGLSRFLAPMTSRLPMELSKKPFWNSIRRFVLFLILCRWIRSLLQGQLKIMQPMLP